jgi:hypothetical protein
MRSPRLDRAFVVRWSRAYIEGQSEQEAATEGRLFAEIGAQARRRGYLTSDALLEIGEWKSHRARSKLRGNPPDLVETVTRQAFDAPDERLTVLTSLQGVGEPIASAILSVWDPSRYTIFDVRAVATLTAARQLPASPKVGFGLYLATCRALASTVAPPDADISPLRALDRALWKWSQVHDRP